MKRALWFALVALLCVPAIAPLLSLPFFSSDDGLFHLYRLAALDDALRHGEFYPRIFPSFAFGYGQAVLSYYGPLSYYVAELIHWFGANFADAIKWTFALGLIASACTLFMLAREFVAPAPALLAAVAYVYFPYHLADTYQRGALAEQLAFAFLPLVLWGVTPPSTPTSFAKGKRMTARLLVFTLSLSALILTHALTAMIFLPFVIVYALIIYQPTIRISSLIARRSSLVAVVLALGISAFYWLPIVFQSRWVGLSAGDNDGYRAHLAPALSFVQPSLVFQYAPSQLVSADHPLGLPSFAMLLAALVLALQAWRARAQWLTPLLLFVALSLVSLAMTLDLSLPVWQTFQPLLAFLQYPWRFLTLAAIGIALCAAFVFAQHARLALFASLVLIVSATLALNPRAVPAPASDDFAMWQNDYAHKQIGATWTAEYMPWWVRADRTAIPNGARFATADVMQPAPVLSLGDASGDYMQRRYHLRGSAQSECESLTLRFHQFYLPQWRVKLGSRSLATFPSTDLGLLSVDVPCRSADTSLTVEFAPSAIEQAASLVSLVALIIVLWLWRGRWLIAVLVALGVISALAFVRMDRRAPLDVNSNTQLADVADLIGVRYERDHIRAGDDLRVTLVWLARREVSENFKVFVHVMDANNARVLAQSDGDPLGGFTPTTQWHVGEVIEDARVLHIPDDAAGDLQLLAGMYRFPELQNLPTWHDGSAFADNRIPIGAIHVDAR